MEQGLVEVNELGMEEVQDYQGEVEEQRREPYQNADVVIDILVEQGRALPDYE